MGDAFNEIFKAYFYTFLIVLFLGIGGIIWYASQWETYNNSHVLISKRMDKNLIKFENDKIIITIPNNWNISKSWNIQDFEFFKIFQFY